VDQSPELQLFPLLMGLFGGLALFLYGMDQLADSLKTVAGGRMKTLLSRLTTNRFMGAVSGALVTAVIQSSSVTTVLVVGFISAGLMTMVQSVGVIMGANIGTTVTAQIVAFKVTEYALLLIALGFAVRSLSRRDKVKHQGVILMGLGLIFFGMGVMGDAMDPLVRRMETADRVTIQGSGTDLTFSIKDIPVVKCAGNRNIPDGEVYTAPVRDSVNGTIRYTARTLYQGTIFENIALTFRDGRIVEAEAGDKSDALNRILDTDDGARFVGEFAIGVNPYLDRPILDILFDEKIGGSFHFTPGAAYEAADNGNRSSVHWDMVCIQTPAFGGGTIAFDDEVIRRDGLFVVDDLVPLNPENLKS